MSGRTKGSVRERTRADGTILYQARWWDVTPGQEPAQRTKSFLTRAEADDHLAAVHRSKRDQKYHPPSDLTVSELVNDYIDRAADAGRISERTVLTYRARHDKMIAPTIGKTPLEELRPLEVQRWIDRLSRKGFAATTIHPAIAVLMGALREAALLGITDRHLGHGIRRPKLTPPQARTWTAEQARAVLAAVRDDPIYGALYHVAIMAGLRPGEVRGLCWEDVDLEHGAITVRRTISKDVDGHEIIAARTKTKKARVVPIPPVVVEVLRWHRVKQKERRLACAEWQPLGIVFDRGDGHWLYQSQWLAYHGKLCARVGVPVIRHHDLRHGFATLMLETGAHPRVVSEMLGHATVTMTLDRYSHPAHASQRAAIDELAEVVFGPESPATNPATKATKLAT
jgi:integrase